MEIIPPIWRKSRRSGMNGECVELARLAEDIAVRDSKAPPGAILKFRADSWQAFVTEVRRGRFDLS